VELKDIKEFNSIFLRELNKNVRRKQYLEEITEKELNSIHRLFANRIIHLLYSYLRVDIKFGHYFTIQSDNTSNYPRPYYFKWPPREPKDPWTIRFKNTHIYDGREPYYKEYYNSFEAWSNCIPPEYWVW